MTDEKKKMTAHGSSVGADDGQSISQNSKTTIPDPDEKSNSPERDLEELYRKMRRMSDPAYLHTVTLDELMDNVFQGKSAVIENLLYTGAYILAGAPKIGKSFLVAQIAHHVSTGQDLWGYKVHQGTVLYLALEDDESRLQRRMFRMFGVEGTWQRLRTRTTVPGMCSSAIPTGKVSGSRNSSAVLPPRRRRLPGNVSS